MTGAQGPDLRVCRKAADEECRCAHQHERRDEHGLPPELVADVPHEKYANGARYISDAKGCQREQRTGGRLAAGKQILLNTSAAAVP